MVLMALRNLRRNIRQTTRIVPDDAAALGDAGLMCGDDAGADSVWGAGC